MYDAEIASRTPRSSFFNCLKNSAKQFYIRRGDGMYIISGFPWGVVLARNTFMAVPGLTLAIDHRADYEAIMETALKALTHFADTGELSKHIKGIDLPDIPLWAIWAIQQYAKTVGTDEARKLYLESVTQLVDYILRGGHPNLFIDSDTGLISTDGHLKPASWMNSMLNGEPVVRRTGRLVEFNALWYNALMFAAALAEGNDGLAERRKAWLAEAGVDELALALRANDNWVSTLAPAIAEDWKAMGVTAEVVLLDTTALFADLSTEPEPGTLLPFDVVLSPGDPSCFGNDADLIISWWYGDNVWTRARSRWATTPAFAEVAELLAEARSKTSEDE